MEKLMKTVRVILDIVIFLAVCCATYAVFEWVQPIKRGFFCSDESLSYSYHKSTISLRTLFIIEPALPSFVIFVVEHFKRVPYSAAAVSAAVASRKKINSYRLAYRLRQCYTQIGTYLFGYVLTIFAGEIAKRSIGRLRPHFFAMCQPHLPDGSTCDDPVNFDRYIEDYTCGAQNSTKAMLDGISKSFPSGHAGLVFYSMLYTSIYLQASLSTRASKLLKHVLQFNFMLFALYVALTRVSDNMHHWSDVAAGVLLGSIMAVSVALFVANLIGEREMKRRVRYVKASRLEPQPCISAQFAPPAASIMPAYVFGSSPNQQHPYAAQKYQYGGQTYHNYGYGK